MKKMLTIVIFLFFACKKQTCSKTSGYCYIKEVNSGQVTVMDKKGKILCIYYER